MNLEQQLKVALASLMGLHFSLLFCHYNVEGANFVEYHKFFNKYYEYVADSYDRLAEELRALDIYVPVNFKTYDKLSVVIQEHHVIPSEQMFKNLLINTDKVIEICISLNELSKDHPGLQNFIQELTDKLSWYSWQVRATCKQV